MTVATSTALPQSWVERLDSLNHRLHAVGLAIDKVAADAPNPVRHALTVPGRRLRPALALVGAELGGVAQGKAEQFAAAIELIHVASLVHDDVVDDAAVRRGQQSVHAAFGAGAAVISGDWLVARALHMLANASGPAGLACALTTVERMSSAELRAFARARDWGVEASALVQEATDKTASLFALALAGLLVGREGHEQLHLQLSTFGHELGLAFQILDDTADLLAPRKSGGKPRLCDLASGKITLPLLLMYRATDSETKAWLDSRLGDPAASAESHSRLLEIAAATGTVERLNEMVRERCDVALKQTQGSDVSPSWALLRDVVLAIGQEADNLCSRSQK